MKRCDPLDIIGKKFTRWTVKSLCEHRDEYGFYHYLCVCECENEKYIMRGSLISGKSQSCGCLNKELTSVRSKLLHQNADVSNMIGKVFGRLTVLHRSDTVDRDNKYPYICKCECGNETAVTKSNLTSERTRSCGCYNKETLIERFQDYRELFDHVSCIGKIFGRLTLIEYAGYRGSSLGHCFKCKCSCGNIKESISLYNLEKQGNGNTRSCGCIAIEKYDAHLDNYEKWINQQERKKFVRSELRQDILDRDGRKCFICKYEFDNLEVHHIEPWKYNKDLRFDIDNLITLCFDCHFDLAHCGEIGIGIDLDWADKFKAYIASIKQEHTI